MSPPPPLPMPYFNTEAGYWLEARGPWVRFGGTFGHGCPSFFCSVSVSVRFADARAGLAVDRADPLGDTVIIKGRNLRAVKASWLRSFADTTFEGTEVDGARAVIANSATDIGRSALVVRDGRLFLISASYLLGVGSDELESFLSGFHFMPAACWIEPCREDGWWEAPDPLVAFDTDAVDGDAPGGGWSNRGASWHAGPGPGDRSIATYWRGNCVDNLCAGYVSVTIGTASTGPVVGSQLSNGRRSWIRASGTTLDEVAASAKQIVQASTVDPVKVDGAPARLVVAEGRVIVLVVHRHRIIAITAFGGFMANNARETLESFLAGFRLLG